MTDINFYNFRCESKSLVLCNYITTELKHNSPKLFYTKDISWSLEKQSELIQSIILRLSIGEFWFYAYRDDYLICIDGNKRLETLYSYLRNDFYLDHLTLKSSLNGLKFNELSINYQRRIKQSTMQVNYMDLGTDIKYRNEVIRILKCQ